MATVELSSLRKTFGSQKILEQVDLKIESGEFLVIVGPSGSGKSTLLRLIAGLDHPTSGVILFDDKVVNILTPTERGVAMVFQNYALYPHMTAFQNIGFSLRMQGVPDGDIGRRVLEVARLLNISEHLKKKPAQMSGGQKQRVAIGRALVRTPKVFLFDEPLSNLDAQLRLKMRAEIAQLHRTFKTTTVYVTHDQVEAMTLADRIAVLNDGQIEQVGTPSEIYENPRTAFVASFIGSPAMNFLPAALVPADLVVHGAVTVGFRPDCIAIGEKRASYKVSLGTGIVRLVESVGSMAYVCLEFPGGYTAMAEIRREKRPKPDEQLEAFISSENLYHFNKKGLRIR